MTSMLDQIVNVLPVLGGVVFLAILMYVFYSNPRARKMLGSIFPLLPLLLEFAASKIPDKKGVFDNHDMATLTARVVKRLSSIVSDPSNLKLSDVEEDIRDLVSEELAKYQAAGIKGVPDLSSDQVSKQVHIIFGALKTFAEQTEDAGTDQ